MDTFRICEGRICKKFLDICREPESIAKYGRLCAATHKTRKTLKTRTHSSTVGHPGGSTEMLRSFLQVSLRHAAKGSCHPIPQITKYKVIRATPQKGIPTSDPQEDSGEHTRTNVCTFKISVVFVCHDGYNARGAKGFGNTLG